MPLKVVKRGDSYRLIEATTGRIAKNKGGSAVDGGGHKSKSKAQKQASAVNASLHRKGKI